jgi:hypothetical protein
LVRVKVTGVWVKAPLVSHLGTLEVSSDIWVVVMGLSHHPAVSSGERCAVGWNVSGNGRCEAKAVQQVVEANRATAVLTRPATACDHIIQLDPLDDDSLNSVVRCLVNFF